MKCTGDPHRRRLRTWQDAAAECDLQVVKASDWRLTARADSVEVQIEAHGDIAGFARDPRTRVRLQNLLLLIREFPRYPETLEALRTACSDRSSEIRLWAARELGAEGRDVLLVLTRKTMVDRVSAEAVSILGRELPVKRTRALLDRSLRSRRVQTARACLEALGQSEDAAAVEPSLIRALQREEADLRIAAATALGRVGTAAAVLPLKDAAESSPRDKELRRATRQAVAEIQARLHGASPGQLSLAGAETGQLSLAQTEGGELSIAADPAGQLSLPSDPAGQRSLPKER